MKRNNATTRLRKALTTLSILMYSTIIFAQQSQLLSWAIPPNQVNFSSVTPVSSALPGLVYPGNATRHLLNSMHESNGDLLFFVTEDSGLGAIYDKDGALIDNLHFTSYDIPPQVFGDELSIVPMPGSCTKYYIIGTYRNNDQSSYITFLPFYAILDLSIPNSNGVMGALIYPPGYPSSGVNIFNDLVDKAQQQLSPDCFSSTGIGHPMFNVGLSVVQKTNNSFFLFIRNTFSGGTSNSNKIYRYIINNTGIIFDGTFNIPSNASVNNPFYSEMETIKLPNGNYRLALATSEKVHILELFPNGNPFSTGQVVTFTSAQVKGLEFSPAGNFLYYTFSNGGTGGTGGAGYIDCNTSIYTRNDFSSSQYTDANFLGASFVELGYDPTGRQAIYFNAGSMYKLMSLAHPDLTPNPTLLEQ